MMRVHGGEFHRLGVKALNDYAPWNLERFVSTVCERREKWFSDVRQFARVTSTFINFFGQY
jgi:hypothetical protein